MCADHNYNDTQMITWVDSVHCAKIEGKGQQDSSSEDHKFTFAGIELELVLEVDSMACTIYIMQEFCVVQ